MRRFSSLALAAIVSVMGSAASAENIVASDPGVLLSYLLGKGYSANMTKDDYGDPKIEVQFSGEKFQVYYYGCANGKYCQAIQFFSGYRTNGEISLKKINSWNTDKRYARAYLSKALSARIEYDVLLGNAGMTEEDFDDVFSIWTSSVKDFEKFIDW